MKWFPQTFSRFTCPDGLIARCRYEHRCPRSLFVSGNHNTFWNTSEMGVKKLRGIVCYLNKSTKWSFHFNTPSVSRFFHCWGVFDSVFWFALRCLCRSPGCRRWRKARPTPASSRTATPLPWSPRAGSPASHLTPEGYPRWCRVRVSAVNSPWPDVPLIFSLPAFHSHPSGLEDLRVCVCVCGITLTYTV